MTQAECGPIIVERSPTPPRVQRATAPDSGSQGPLPRSYVCLECGYDLRGIPEHRCPECGWGFHARAIERISRSEAVYREVIHRRMAVSTWLAVVLGLPWIVATHGVATMNGVLIITIALAAFLIFQHRVGNGGICWITEHPLVRAYAILATLPIAAVLVAAPAHAYVAGIFVLSYAAIQLARLAKCSPYSGENIPFADQRRNHVFRTLATAGLLVAELLYAYVLILSA